MSTKLSSITTQYRRFTKNQVLTEGNLNEVVDFFDDQDRLSRIYLSGTGIVCGFKVTLDASKTFISITQGTGVTTDGDLFKLYQTNLLGEKIIDFDKKIYTHCKIYDNKKAAYKPYFYDGSNKQLALYELLTADQLANEKDPYFALTKFTANTKFQFKDAVTLLYLESYEKDSDLCVSLSCDNQGLEIIGNYKVLIVSKTVADQINSHDSIISKVNYSNLYHQLPNVKSNRIVLHPDDFIHLDIIKESFTKGIFKNNVVGRLLDGYTKLLTALEMPTFLESIIDNLKKVFDFESNVPPTDFQYRYGLLNDLVATYNEIKLLLLGMDSDYCCPDIKAFPKHLMLGELIKTEPCFEYRHAFYKSPLLTGENLCTCNDCLTNDSLIITGEKTKETLLPEVIVDPEGKEIKVCYGENTNEQRLYSLIKRAAQLLENYNADYDFIKITPSLQLGKLGKKAIPFYNNVGDCLIENWDFDKTVLGNQRDNYSYHDDLLNTKMPLQIHFDNDFYRIEGHQGLNYKEALKIIQQIRRENGLGFNVVVLAVNATDFEKTKQEFTKYYLEKNHGYEHKAGVAPGGTFIMIYVEEEIPYYYAKTDGPSLTGDFEKPKASKMVTDVINPIVADFTLPYLCCDDGDISLTLPVEKLCFDDKTPSLPFKVSPTGGFVKANVKAGQNGGVTVNELGATVFDPKLVSKELIGKVITFTVNNLDTKCQITIFNKPKFDFTSTILNPPGISETEVTFTLAGDELLGNKYTWDFGDKSDAVTDDKNTIKHTYKYDSTTIKKFTFNVKVAADNGNCGLEITHPVSFEVVDPKIVIDDKLVDNISICRDGTEHILTLNPNIKGITIKGIGVSINTKKQIVFVGEKVAPNINSVTIFINDKPSNLVITLLETTVASFTASIDAAGNLVLNNNSQNAEKYTWKIGKETFETDKNGPIIRPVSSFGTAPTVSVSLTAQGKCSTAIDGPRDIVIIKNTDTNTCLDTATLFLSDAITSIITMKGMVVSKKFNKATVQFISETETRFSEVQKNTPAYINGTSNDKLPLLFAQDYLDFINSTVATINKLSGQVSPEENTAIQTLVSLNNTLFYTILRCQKPADIAKIKDSILFITALFNRLFTSFVEIKFNVDKNGTLKEFLKNMLVVFTKIDFLVSEIQKEITILNDGNQF